VAEGGEEGSGEVVAEKERGEEEAGGRRVAVWPGGRAGRMDKVGGVMWRRKVSRAPEEEMAMMDTESGKLLERASGWASGREGRPQRGMAARVSVRPAGEGSLFKVSAEGVIQV
jgi:hypothetical protein